MKQFVMYGAGSIGRGFIGSLFSKLGYEITFIDVNDDVVRLLNQFQSYDQIIVGDQPETIHIEHVKAIDGKKEQDVCQAIANADLMATAVGANVLPKIAPFVAKGLEERQERPLDILICENLNHADRIFHDEVAQYISDPKALDTYVGFVETSIGKMVPHGTMNHPLDVRQEAYEYLPVNKEALKTALPNCENIIPYSPFQYFVERKLFIHNMAHFTMGLLGAYEGFTYIDQAASCIPIQWIVKKCMEESATALSQQYDVPIRDLELHINDLLYRFQNVELKDTVQRVARDPMRKIKPSDRLVGAIRKSQKAHIQPVYLAFALSLALYTLQDQNIKNLLITVCEIKEDESVYACIKQDLDWLKNHPSLDKTVHYLEKQEHEINGSVI